MTVARVTHSADFTRFRFLGFLGLTDSYIDGHFEEITMLIQKALKKIDAHMVFDEMPNIIVVTFQLVGSKDYAYNVFDEMLTPTSIDLQSPNALRPFIFDPGGVMRKFGYMYLGFSASTEGSTELHFTENWRFQTQGFQSVRPRIHPHNRFCFFLIFLYGFPNEFWKHPDGLGYRPKYLMVVVFGVLNQQRSEIVDDMVIVRILETSLIVTDGVHHIFSCTTTLVRSCCKPADVFWFSELRTFIFDPGRGKHFWVSADTCAIDSSFFFQCFEWWQSHYSATIMLVAVMAMIPHRVVQLGSLDEIPEDLSIVGKVREAIYELHDSFLAFEALTTLPRNLTNRTAFATFINITDVIDLAADAIEIDNDNNHLGCDEVRLKDPIDCSDTEVFNLLMRTAIEQFKDIHFYRFGKPVRGADDFSCHMTWFQSSAMTMDTVEKGHQVSRMTWIECRDSESLIQVWVGYNIVSTLHSVLVTQLAFSMQLTELMHLGFYNYVNSHLVLIGSGKFKDRCAYNMNKQFQRCLTSTSTMFLWTLVLILLTAMYLDFHFFFTNKGTRYLSFAAWGGIHWEKQVRASSEIHCPNEFSVLVTGAVGIVDYHVFLALKKRADGVLALITWLIFAVKSSKHSHEGPKNMITMCSFKYSDNMSTIASDDLGLNVTFKHSGTGFIAKEEEYILRFKELQDTVAKVQDYTDETLHKGTGALYNILRLPLLMIWQHDDQECKLIICSIISLRGDVDDMAA